jgi:hypothetical protein
MGRSLGDVFNGVARAREDLVGGTLDAAAFIGADILVVRGLAMLVVGLRHGRFPFSGVGIPAVPARTGRGFASLRRR